MSYDRLIAEHMHIEFVAKRLWVLADFAEPDVADVLLALSELSYALLDHLAHEDSFIYPRMIAAENTGMAEVAARFVDEFAALREDWGIYLREWNGDCIAADWDHFRGVTHAILGRLAARVHAENELLYPAALRNGVIPLRSKLAA